MKNKILEIFIDLICFILAALLGLGICLVFTIHGTMNGMICGFKSGIEYLKHVYKKSYEKATK